jgi:hypothetical protein
MSSNFASDMLLYTVVGLNHRESVPQVMRTLNNVNRDADVRFLGTAAEDYSYDCSEGGPPYVTMAINSVARDIWNNQTPIRANQPVIFRLPNQDENGLANTEKRSIQSGQIRPILEPFTPGQRIIFPETLSGIRLDGKQDDEQMKLHDDLRIGIEKVC